MNGTYLRGEIYFADLESGVGSEQMGYRPVLIIQNDTGNKHSPTVIIASLTSEIEGKVKLPTHYFLKAGNGLERDSFVLLEQIRTVDKRRLDGFIGKLNEKQMDKLLCHSFMFICSNYNNGNIIFFIDRL